MPQEPPSTEETAEVGRGEMRRRGLHLPHRRAGRPGHTFHSCSSRPYLDCQIRLSLPVPTRLHPLSPRTSLLPPIPSLFVSFYKLQMDRPKLRRVILNVRSLIWVRTLKVRRKDFNHDIKTSPIPTPTTKPHRHFLSFSPPPFPSLSLLELRRHLLI